MPDMQLHGYHSLARQDMIHHNTGCCFTKQQGHVLLVSSYCLRYCADEGSLNVQCALSCGLAHLNTILLPAKLCAQFGLQLWLMRAPVGYRPTPIGRNSSSQTVWLLHAKQANSWATSLTLPGHSGCCGCACWASGTALAGCCR